MYFVNFPPADNLPLVKCSTCSTYKYCDLNVFTFYRTMHFSAKRGIVIACRLSVCLSVTLVDCDHIDWHTSEIISPLVSLGCSLSADPNIMGLLQGEHPKFEPKVK